MKRTHALALVAAIVVIAVVVYFATRDDKGGGTAGARGSAALGSAGVGATGSGAGSAGAEAPADDDPGGADSRFRVIDADARIALRQRIEAARKAREAGTPRPPEAAPGAGDPAPLPGMITSQDVQNGIMDLIPLFEECYVAGLERKTITSAKVSFDMTIIGEPEVGTLVDHAEIGGDPAVLADTELTTCLHETMMSIELPPMSEGATVVVKTGMAFSPDEEAE